MRQSTTRAGFLALGVLAALTLGACAGGSGGGGTTKDGSVPVDTGVGPQAGDKVGSPCTSASTCSSNGTAACLTAIKPLASLAGADAFADIGLTFPNGYCSNAITPPCSADAQCGTGGKCFRPFTGVDQQTLRDLEVPLMVSPGSLNFLPSYGVCLAGCTSTADCSAGQICAKPFEDLIAAVPGSVNDTPYCITVAGCESCDTNAKCELDFDGAGTNRCVCNAGYTGTGTTCAAVSGACSSNPCKNNGACSNVGSSFACDCSNAGGYTGPTCEVAPTVATTPIGGACAADSECNVKGGGRCYANIRPLLNVLPPGSFLRTVGLTFSAGYCSNKNANEWPPTSTSYCTANNDCGPNGGCLAPFRNVTEQTLRDLEASFEPDLATGALDYLPSYGVCLRSCADNFDCIGGQSCEIVMDEFIKQVPGSENKRPYCVPGPGQCEFCDPHAYCEANATGDDGICKCRAGYMGNGYTCAPKSTLACADAPCQNGGSCTDGANQTYLCACATGFTGTNCQIAVVPAECQPNPCKNGGTCTAGPTCACPAGYMGSTCETQVMCPTPVAPANGNVLATGTTVGSTVTYGCDSGYTMTGSMSATCNATGPTSAAWSSAAPTCAPTVGPCSGNPCQNGGTCNPNGASYTCSCLDGYSGTTCGTKASCGALTNPGNGTVSTTPDTLLGATATYACNANFTLQGSASRSCGATGPGTAAWTGTAPTCQAATTDPCMPNPCLNGGTCASSGGATPTAVCTCANGYSGTTCQTPASCGALTITNGTVSTTSTTVGGVATYMCNSGYAISGTATRNCAGTAPGTAAWSGTAPTCNALSCGTYTDVVYAVTAGFAIKGTSFGAGNQAFTGLGPNNTTPMWGTNGGTGSRSPFERPPYGGGTTFTRGFVRLRYTNNASGTPIAGTVRLVEWYVPLEFHQTAGATVDADVDHSLGIINNALTNCGGGDTACAAHTPALNRTCASNASGTLSGTTLTWGACTPNPSGSNSWAWSNARASTGVGCATGYNAFGNTRSTSGLVPAEGKGDSYQTWNQQLKPFTFSGTNPLTATFTMPEMQIPNGTGASNTWLQITGSTVIGTDCGTTVGTDLACDIQ